MLPSLRQRSWDIQAQLNLLGLNKIDYCREESIAKFAVEKPKTFRIDHQIFHKSRKINFYNALGSKI